METKGSFSQKIESAKISGPTPGKTPAWLEFKEIELRYSRLRFGLASGGYRGLGVHERPVYTAG